MALNNNVPKSLGMSSPPFINAAMVSPSMSANPTSHLHGQPQLQSYLSSAFQGQFQLSPAQAQAITSQSKSQAHAQAQAVHAQIQAQLHAQGLSLNPSQTIGIANMGASSSLPMMTPGSAVAKRALQKPPVRPPNTSTANNIASPLKPMEMGRKKKQKLPEKQLQERMASLLPESPLYTQLLEFECRVDAGLARKKVDIQEALKIPPCIQKTLRIYVFNTFSNQSSNTPNTDPPTWTLKIIGRILEDGMDPDQPAAVQRSCSYPKFSSFFKHITISLDQRLYPENHLIIWEQARSPALQEGFEVKRKGDKGFAANIRFDINYVPEKFKLSVPLMEVLGMEVDTRPRIIAAIWQYAKARKLQDPNDPSFFICDPFLRRVFEEERMKFTMVSHKISRHLSPPQPIHLQHEIKLSGNNPVGDTCYDILVDVPFPIQRELSLLLSNTEKNKEIEACDDAISNAIKKIHEHRRRRAFFLGFSQSPVEFINTLIESQSKDLKFVSGESGRSAEKERRSEFFGQPWVEDAVIRYLNRKSSGGGNDFPGSA